MSWNSLFIVVKNCSADDLAKIGMTPIGAPVHAEEATGSGFEGVALLQYGADTVLLNGDNSLLTGGSILAQLLAKEVVTALFAGVSDSYLWRVDTPGVERSWMAHAGETIDQTGLATPEEYGVLALDEDSLWTLLEKRTGFGASDRWLSMTAQPVSWPPTAPASQPKEKRRFFSR